MVLACTRWSWIPTAALICASSATAAQHLDWDVYRDGIYGCRLDYPAALFSPEARDAGEPQAFSGPEGIRFRILGLENATRWTPQDIRENFLNDEMPGDITYESTRDEFLVLSGYRDDDIFYTRVAVSSDRRVACILDVTYPRALKRQFDAIITRMSRSFHVNR